MVLHLLVLRFAVLQFGVLAAVAVIWVLGWAVLRCVGVDFGLFTGLRVASGCGLAVFGLWCGLVDAIYWSDLAGFSWVLCSCGMWVVWRVDII